MASRDHERYLEMVLLENEAVDLVVRAIAGVFGLGSIARIAIRQEPRGHPREEASSDDGAGLPVYRVHSIEQAASAYLPTRTAARQQLLEWFNPKDRREVMDFDQSASMRSRSAVDRTRQVRAWKRQGSLTAFPARGPSRLVLHALVDAQLDGPLEAWLLLYAIGDESGWPLVCRYMTACGHPEWAVWEAARRILNGDRHRSYREAAKDQACQESRFRRQVQAAEKRLLDWLDRASRRVAAAMGAVHD